MIAIVDYGMGNLRSVEKAFHAVGQHAFVASDPERVARADRVVLPGVGAFGAAMDNLRASGMADAVTSFIQSGRPFLGICLGLQLLFSESEESRQNPGLGLIPGRVLRFSLGNADLKVPHMGWNALEIHKPAPPLKDMPDGGMAYFVHSFYAAPQDSEVVAATTTYGVEFCSAIWKDNVFAVQFHPEKSGALGLAVLKDFGDWEA